MLVHELFESRKRGLSYEEKHVKGVLKKVILSLDGSDSAIASRLAKRYVQLDAAAQEMQERRNELNAEVKRFADELFNVEDALVTRIIDTASFTLMLSASEKAENKPKKFSTDYESAFRELSLMVPELEEAVKALVEKYTTEVAQKDTVSKLSVEPKLQESLMGSIKDWFKRWASAYDKKLAALKAKYKV